MPCNISETSDTGSCGQGCASIPCGRVCLHKLRLSILWVPPYPNRHEHITGGYPRVYLRHLGEVVGQEGRGHPRQEHAGAHMEQP
jgi:hypothetical protein